MAHLQYDRPDLDQTRNRPALYVTGAFARAKPSQQYEGRLQIQNSIGSSAVRQIDGDALPEGAQLRVDQSTQEVVVAWPSYQTAQAPIANPGFEEGNTGWEAGAGWVIAKENPPSGQWAAGYNNNRGMSRISNGARYKVQPGQITTAKCDVRQGASSEENAGASVMLEYRDAAGDVIYTVEGNRVMSASKNRVYPSNVFGAAPAGAATINVAGNGIRYRENKILFVDNFEWNHTVSSAGINIETVFNLVLLVNDSTGRSYIWRGQIMVAVRPARYRFFAKFVIPYLHSLGYRHAQSAIDSLGLSTTTEKSNTGFIGASDDGTLGASTYTVAPGVSVYPVTQSGAVLPEFPAISPVLPGAGKCAVFSRSGQSIIIGHNSSPYIRAHAVSQSGIGAQYPPPAEVLPDAIIDAAFNPAGDVIYMVCAQSPFLFAYQWIEGVGFGARLNGPGVTFGSSISALSINESGTHLAAICGASPSCHIFKIGSNGFDGRIAAFGSNAQGRVALSDAARAVVFGSSFAVGMHQYLWDPVNGVGDAYTQPPGLTGLARGVSFSKDGLVLYVGVTSNSGVHVYEWSPGVGVTSGPFSIGGTASTMTIPID